MSEKEQEDADGVTAVHQPTGRWKLGLVLVLITVVLWSTVPIALSLLLDKMDAITITWYRFAVGAAVLAGLLGWKGNLPRWKVIGQPKWFAIFLVAGIALAGNFALYLYALNFIPPGASQIIMNLAPLFVVLGSVVLFGERIRGAQLAGLVLLLLGLLLFFNERVMEFTSNLTGYAFGALVVLAAALVWSTYALAQKQLLRASTSMQIMLVVYTIGLLAMIPFCKWSQIAAFNSEQYIVLAYSSANTLVAYGCFAEALQHWEASRVSTIACITPLLTLVLSHPAHAIWPDRVRADELNWIGLLGALFVVGGSMIAALSGRQSGITDE